MEERYQEEAALTCSDSQYSTMLHVIALANVVAANIRCIYPSRFTNLLRPLLNCTIEPRGTTTTSSVAVMWSNTRPIEKSSEPAMQWRPNHFVPLLPVRSCPSDQEKIPLSRKRTLLSQVHYGRQLTLGQFFGKGVIAHNKQEHCTSFQHLDSGASVVVQRQEPSLQPVDEQELAFCTSTDDPLSAQVLAPPPPKVLKPDENLT